MANKLVEIHIPEEVYDLVKKRAEEGVRKGRGAAVKVTIGEMASLLVSTGIKRRNAANKWARANAPTPKPKKVKPPKVVKAKKPAKAKPTAAEKKARKGGKRKGKGSAASSGGGSVLD